MNTFVCSPVSFQASPSGLVALRFGSGPAKPSHLPYFPCLTQEMAVYPPLRDYWSLCARFIPRACLLCSTEPVVEFPSEPLTSFLAAVSPVWTSLGKWYRTCLFELLALFVSSTLPHSQLALKNFSSYPDKAWSPITMFQSLFLSCLTAWVNFTLRQFRFVLACYLSCWKWMLEATMRKFVSKAAMGVKRVGGALCLPKMPFTGCLSLCHCSTVYVCCWFSEIQSNFNVSYYQSVQVPQWNSRLGALDLFFYDVRDNASYPERQKSSLWHAKRVADLTMALLIYSYLFVHSTKQLNIVRTQLWAKQCSASC